MKNSASIIIVNYNGKALLEGCMPSVIGAANSSSFEYEIIVVDNGSRDGSVDFLRYTYPDVKILSMKENRYWFSINEAINKSLFGHLLLLNNDVKLARDCMPYLLEHFYKNDAIFAVTPKEIKWDKVTLSKGAQAAEIKNEAIMPSIENFYFKNSHTTFKADNSMYSKDKLIKLGLFDPLFYPFYYEDVDISYRAWKAGFTIIYEPRAVIYHNSSSTISAYITGDLQTVYGFKNSLLFVWKNVTDTGLFLRHLLFLSAKMIRGLVFFRRNKNILRGFSLAIKSLREVARSRKRVISDFKLSDRKVLEILNARNFYEED